MYLPGNKSMTYYLSISIMLGLIAAININGKAFSQENPLGTIGEPPLSSPVKNTSPFGSKTKTKENNENRESTENGKATVSPFGSGGTDTTVTMPTAPAQPSQPIIADPETVPAPAMPTLLTNPANPVGIAYAEIELDKGLDMLKKKDLVNSKKLLLPLYEWLTELTEFHMVLYKRLKDIETAKNQAQLEKKIALHLALLRDKASYALALISYEEKDYRKAVKYFVDVIKSQPNTELGMKSYELLQVMGFTDKIRLVP